MEENWSTTSGVLQCFHFWEKRERGSARFRRGKEHVGRLLVPMRRGDWGMQRRGSDRQPESDSVWIDPRWKTIGQASWADKLFGLDTVAEIKQTVKIE
jgi:hypothetical protein